MQKTGHLRRELPLDTVSLSNGELGKTVYCTGVYQDSSVQGGDSFIFK